MNKERLCYSAIDMGSGIGACRFRCYRKIGHEGHHSTCKAFTWWD